MKNIPVTCVKCWTVLRPFLSSSRRAEYNGGVGFALRVEILLQELNGNRGLFEVSTPHPRPSAKSRSLYYEHKATKGRFPSVRIPNTRFQTNSLWIVYVPNTLVFGIRELFYWSLVNVVLSRMYISMKTAAIDSPCWADSKSALLFKKHYNMRECFSLAV